MKGQMKKLISILLLALGLTANAQTSSNTLPEPALDALSFLAQGSNWIVAPYGIVSEDGKKFGGGIAAAYKLNDFVVPTLRLDYYDGRVWMPSASMNLQAPINLSSSISVVPFAFAGIATPIAGKGNDNGTAVGIFGAGGAVRLGKHWDLLADVESWSGFPKKQIRLGFAYKF